MSTLFGGPALAVLHLAGLRVLPVSVLHRLVLHRVLLRRIVLRRIVLHLAVLCGSGSGVFCGAVRATLRCSGPSGMLGSPRFMTSRFVLIRRRPMGRVLACDSRSVSVPGHRVIARPGGTALLMRSRIGRASRSVIPLRPMPAVIVLDRETLLERIAIGGRASLRDRIPPSAGNEEEKRNGCKDDE